MAPDRYLNLVYYWLAHGKTTEQLADLDRQLSAPIGGGRSAPAGAWSPEAEMELFRSAQR